MWHVLYGLVTFTTQGEVRPAQFVAVHVTCEAPLGQDWPVAGVIANVLPFNTVELPVATTSN